MDFNATLLSEGVVYSTALYLAAQNGNWEIVKYISELNLEPLHEELEKCTGLYFAAQRGHLDMFRTVSKSLIAYKKQQKTNQNMKQHGNNATLNRTVSKSRFGYKKQLEKIEEDKLSPIVNDALRLGVNYKDSFGNTALHNAAKSGDIKLMELLLSNGANINNTNNRLESALHMATTEGHTNVVHMLLNNGACIDSINSSNNTSINQAIINCYSSIVKLLLENGAKLNVFNSRNSLNLIETADVLNVIVSFKENINLKDSYGNNLLHIAVNTNFVTSLSVCIKNGISVESKDYFNRTAIYLAIEKGNIEIVRELLKHNASMYTKFGYNLPIHQATALGHYDIVELFLENGVDIHINNKKSRTCLYLAVSHGYDEIVSKLLTRGAHVGVEKKSLIIVAVKGHHTKVVEILLDSGSKTLSKTSFYLLLSKAASYSNLDIVKLLLKYGNSRFPKFDKCEKEKLLSIADTTLDPNIKHSLRSFIQNNFPQ